MNAALILLVVIAGILNTVQSGSNATLHKTLDRPVWCVVAVFAVALATSLIAALAKGEPFPSTASLARAPWWAWIGGLLGMPYVFSMLLFADKLGSAVFGAVTLSTGIITAVVLDHFGLVGFKQHPVNAWRIVGCVLMIAGSGLIAKF